MAATRLRIRSELVTEEARRRGDLTLIDIATRVGVRESTISRLMSGATGPTLETALAICREYDLNIVDLVQRQGELATAVPAQRGAAA